MEKLFINIFQMSVSASYLILAVLIVRSLLRKAPKSMRSFLWLLVGIRLVIPFSVESVFSLIPNTQAVDEYIYDTVQPGTNTLTDAPNTEVTVSLPYQNTVMPSSEKHMGKMPTAVQICARIWLAGMALMLVYMLTSWLRLKRRVKTAVPMNAILDFNSANINQKIYQSDAIESPFLFGIIRPRIYIPNSVAEEELPYIVQHEMTHLKRKDYLVKPAGFLLLSVYWFNPFVWAAYIMLCKDIELICDEKVIRQLGASCKKAYSQALLNSASNRRMIAACPVAFGEVSVKERVKNVLNYKKPAFWVLAAAVLACIIVPVCFMTQKKVDASENSADSADAEAQNEGTNDGTMEAIPSEDYNLDDLFSMAGEYEMLNMEPDKYRIVPNLSLDEDGQFTFLYDPLSSYLCAGKYDRTEDGQYIIAEDDSHHYQFTYIDSWLLLFDAEQSSDVSRIDDKVNLIAPVENGSLFVKNSIYTVLNDVKKLSQSFNQKLSQGTTMTMEELRNQQESLMEMQNQLIMGEMKVQRQQEKAKELQLTKEESDALEARLQEWIQEAQSALQQLEEDLNTCQDMIDAAENTDSQTAYDTVEQWAKAFCDRDGAAIVKLADEKAERDLVDRELLLQSDNDGKDYVAFGWSSPWPWGDTDNNYCILNVTDRYAEILYYAWVSNPHVTVWREQLTFKMENDKYVITSETLQFMDSICTAGEFQQAYPDGITGTMMDYVSFNGAGEALNNHATSNRDDWWYGKLLEPDSAAVTLLNILDNPNKVGVHVEQADTDNYIPTCTVTFDFYEDGSSVSVQMMQPYTLDGIWVPYAQTAPMIQAQEDVASVSPNIITSQNVADIIAEDAELLEALFPEHHESIPNVSFPYMIDLNGDGIEEKLEFTDLRYNGGDGGYALTVTDTKTGKRIPLPDGYTEESGFPIRTFYMQQEEEAQLLVQLGEEKNCQIVATIMPLYEIYERRGMYAEFKGTLPDHSGQVAAADALSGCNIYYYNNEENPVILLKTYVSGFLGHADTLGYVITELRLQKDNTWASKHYFLLDGCRDISVTQTESGSIPVPSGNGNSFLPYSDGMDIDFIPLTPEN